jgi:adenosylcobinamide-GDP ribazoletransferase
MNGIAFFESIFASEPAPVNFDARFPAMPGLVLAIRYLTIVPLPWRGPGDGARLGRAAGWFPVVGAGLGALLAATDWMATRLFPGLLGALLTVTVWKLATGGLHLDGLADCLDGLMGRDREHRLAIMRDSRIGTFGAVGLILFLMLEIVAVAELPGPWRWRVLLAVPAIARATPPVLARLFGAARPDGQGAAFAADVGLGGAVLAVVVALVVSVGALDGVGLLAAAVPLAVAGGAGWWFARRLGGITGDVLGAVVETAELMALLTVLAWLGARA